MPCIVKRMQTSGSACWLHTVDLIPKLSHDCDALDSSMQMAGAHRLAAFGLSMCAAWSTWLTLCDMQESSGEFMLAFPNVTSAVFFCLEVCGFDHPIP